MEDHEGKTVAASHQETVTRVRDALRARGLLQTDAARQVGLSASAVSAFLSGSYKGSRDEVARKLDLWLAGLEGADKLNVGLDRARDFVETPTALKIEDVCAFTKARGIIGVIAGASGVGKSKALKQVPGQHGRVWYCEFEKNDGKSIHATLKAIGRALQLYSTSTHSATLSEMIVQAVTRTRGLLILDEVQHLGKWSLEQVRSIYDATEDSTGSSVGLVLAGHLDLVDKIAALPQLEGRVGRRLLIPSASEADVDALCDFWELACRQSRDLFRSRARDRTGLRRIARVFELALGLAAREAVPVSYEHVRSAWRAFDGAAAN